MNRHANRWVVALATAGMVGALVACGSSGGDTSGGEGGNKTIVLGLATAMTGPTASSYGEGTIAAAKARIDLANAESEIPGVTLKLQTADVNSSPEGAQAAVQSLVESKGADALLVGPYFFGGYRYAVAKGVPTFGVGIDGPEWSDPANKNLFAYSGSTNPDYPSYKGVPQYFQSKGVTKFCGLAYGESAGSKNAANAMIASMKAAGIEVPYANLSVPLGGTDFGAAALAIKKAGCDAIATWFVVSSDIALFQALKGVGISGPDFKASYITGVYGQELLDNSAALEASQGYSIGSVFQVASLKTPATERMMSALKQYAGYDKPYPLSSHQWGWFTADLAIFALKNAAGDLSAANIVAKLRAVTNYDADGLQCATDFTQYKDVVTQFAANCAWIATVDGNGYVSDKDPIRMEIIPGTKNS